MARPPGPREKKFKACVNLSAQHLFDFVSSQVVHRPDVRIPDILDAFKAAQAVAPKRKDLSKQLVVVAKKEDTCEKPQKAVKLTPPKKRTLFFCGDCSVEVAHNQHVTQPEGGTGTVEFYL